MEIAFQRVFHLAIKIRVLCRCRDIVYIAFQAKFNFWPIINDS